MLLNTSSYHENDDKHENSLYWKRFHFVYQHTRTYIIFPWSPRCITAYGLWLYCIIQRSRYKSIEIMRIVHMACAIPSYTIYKNIIYFSKVDWNNSIKCWMWLWPGGYAPRPCLRTSPRGISSPPPIGVPGISFAQCNQEETNTPLLVLISSRYSFGLCLGLGLAARVWQVLQIS